MREQVKLILDQTILSLYRSIRYPVFPIDPSRIVKFIANCRLISYDELSKSSNMSYEDVVKACQSLDGATQYDHATDRYLIAINTSKQYSASEPRIRWTIAHELGHIAAGHFIELANMKCNDIVPSSLNEFEEEADYFAASFLAPSPAIQLMRVKRPADIRDWFGLSQIASEYRWAEYNREIPNIELLNYFKDFRPRSTVKDFRLAHPPGINIRADADYIP